MKTIEFKVGDRKESDAIKMLAKLGKCRICKPDDLGNGLWGLPVADMYDSQVEFNGDGTASLRFFGGKWDHKKVQVMTKMVELYEAVYAEGQK